ncbi:cytochrome P450 [Roridomyces roridus]|uniref:Cytochrome P450 n=1 Tax=Roridomyces roridus TaxID=1738132 RepID=A0AAD7C5E2_9AGAR|nr:cytochrome P450 [Roridomyces roridus]
MLQTILLSLTATVSAIVIWNRLSQQKVQDDVPFLPGPTSDSFFTGNMHTLAAAPSDAAAISYTKTYGGIVKLNGILGVSKHVLLISDPAALRRLFGASTGQWDLSSRNLASFKSLFGPGVSAVEGADHIRQRRVIAQALTPVQTRGMIDSVQDASQSMRRMLNKSCPGTKPVQLDMLHWARRVALDSLTMFAFGVSLHAMEKPEHAHDLMHTFDSMLEDCIGKTSEMQYFLRETAVAGIYPSLLGIAITDMQFFRSMMGTTKRLAQFSEWVRKEREEMGSLGGGSDLLSLLYKANQAESAKYKLEDDEIRALIGMVLFAGHDTVSTTLAMFLNDMARYPTVQQRLRQEINAKRAEIGGDDVKFSQDDYDSMPYLNAVLKESMRMNPVLGQTFRTNRAADVLPLSEPILCTDGKMRSEIAVAEGTLVVIDIVGSNLREDVWGKDAREFRAERWLESEEKVAPREKTPGMVYGSVLNFLAGNRTCPGWRIAVLELQSFICDIVEGFKISAVPGNGEIVREFHGVSIPKVRSEKPRGCEQFIDI